MEEKEKEEKKKTKGEPLFGQNIRETIKAFRDFFQEFKEDKGKQEQEKEKS